ncbi:hypothetical protein FRC08_002624 [Ceratobasidium sp. 394]|nr:hypothetical protein FRC08_002624 [Ceratobasidium sp. 394]
MPHYRGEYVPMHPKFPEGSEAACAKYDSPPDAPSIKNIEYTAEDNAAIEAFIRQSGETCWHSCATVPMKPREQNGCLDPRLNVYGTQNLKVSGKWLRTCIEHMLIEIWVDLSILPGNVGANTYSTALLVGEKAAMLIAEDLGLKSP